MTSITAANAVVMLSVAGLFPTPVQLQGFAADDVFSIPAIAPSEQVMGVDGKLSSGFVYVPIPWAISLQADSLSNNIFDTWYAKQKVDKDVFRASGLVVLPGIGRKWTMLNGVLSSYPPMPEAKKVLQMRKFEITWESVDPAIV